MWSVMFSCQRLSASVAQRLLKLKEARGGAVLCDKQKHHNSEMTSGRSDHTMEGHGDQLWSWRPCVEEHEINRFFPLWGEMFAFNKGSPVYYLKQR